MKWLTISVAIAATIALVSGITQGGIGFLGLAADLALLSSGIAGLALALVTLRSTSISAFLRVFSTIFAVEYVLTGLAYVIVRVGWWPANLADAAPPASLPITVAIFALLVYLVSFVPVIRQITQLADPYFATDDRRDVRVAGFGRRRMTERHFAIALTVMLVVINQLQVAINVRLSFFNRDWFNAIQNKDSAAFWSLLFGVFCFWAAIAVVSALVEYYAELVLKIGWRRWMTERYYGLWLDRGNMYRAALVGQAADNPDQRIAEDVRNFINSSYAYSINVLSSVSSLVSFSIILWTIPADFTIPGTDISVPGLPFWIALMVSVIGTWLAHLIFPIVRAPLAEPDRQGGPFPCIATAPTAGGLGLAQVGEAVRLSGWCHRIRDHGGVLFIDLRDHYGITQCVVDPDLPAFRQAEKLRSEFVIRVDGTVRKRPRGTENPEWRPAWSRSMCARSRCLDRPATCRCRCSATSRTRKTRG